MIRDLQTQDGLIEMDVKETLMDFSSMEQKAVTFLDIKVDIIQYF